VLQAGIAWSENLVIPLAITLVIGAERFLRPEVGLAGRSLLATAAVGLYAAHPRMVPIVALTAVFVLALAAVRAVPWIAAAVSTTILAVGSLSVFVATRAMIDSRHFPDYARSAETQARGFLGALLEPEGYRSVLGAAVGQGWYLLAGSLGLIVLSGWFVAERWPGLDAVRHPGAWGSRERAWVIGTFALMAMAAVFTTSVLAFHDGGKRADHLIYGRYNEAFAPVLIALGAAWLASITSRRRLLKIVGILAASTAGAAIMLLVGRGRGRFDDVIAPPNIWALEIHTHADPRFLVDRATGWAIAGLALMAILAWRWPRITLGAVATGFFALALASADTLTDSQRNHYDSWHLVAQLDQLGRPDAISYDFDETEPFGLWSYQFWLPDVDFQLFRPQRGERPGQDLVIARPHWKLGDELDGRITILDSRHNQAVWVLPGSVQTELDRRGRLLPRGFPTALPRAAMRSGLELQTRGSSITMNPGDTSSLRVVVTHSGARSPWPAFSDWGLPGLVRLGARWFPEGSDGVVAEQRENLGQTLYPGDSDTVALVIAAADESGQALPGGRYRVEISPVQDGWNWFTDLGDQPLTISVEVRSSAT
jgi:hypothetical protein